MHHTPFKPRPLKLALYFISALLLGSLLRVAPVDAAEAELIPRSVLFADPERIKVQVSPDGRYLSWVAPLNGVLNVWVAPRDHVDQARAVTNDQARGIDEYSWSYLPDTILYGRDSGGNEKDHIFAANVVTGESRNLTPYTGAHASINRTSASRPGEILVRINDRDEAYEDLYRVDVKSGQRTLVQKDLGFTQMLADSDYRLRLVAKPGADGSLELLRPDGSGGWARFDLIPVDDVMTSTPVGYSANGNILYSLDSRGRDTAALYAIDSESGKRTLLFEDPKADVERVLLEQHSGEVRAAASEYLRLHWTSIGEQFSADLETLSSRDLGDMRVLSQSADDRLWIVSYNSPERPTTYYSYERANGAPGKLTKLFASRPNLEGRALVPTHAVEIRARDGLTLPSYLTLPAVADLNRDGRADNPVPMVLLVHGGPWARDNYTFSSTRQWLANRGYAVLNVNFRGSDGFGKDFIGKADGEFAGKMHDDLIDAVDWAVGMGVTTKEQVAIMGASYGGYAALVGLTFTPTTFACGVDIVGPSNLVTLINSFPARFAKTLEYSWYKRVGDPRSEEGRKLLLERSPISKIDSIVRPLLIGHGANDMRVLQSESDAVVAEMQRRELPVTYALFPDEGHGFQRPQNQTAFAAITEGFLGTCLGGRAEPIGNDLQGSSVEVRSGAELVDGLTDALKTHKPELKM